MNIFFVILFLIVLFVILGYGADLVISNLKEIGKSLGLKLFFLGIILGLITSLPEFSVGVNSIIRDIPAVSAGNLLGGIIVLMSLILGLNILFNREIITDGKIINLIPFFILILIPFFLSFDGIIGGIDGVILMLSYLFTVWFLYKKNQPKIIPSLEMINRREISREIFFMAVGLILIVVSSSLIVRLAENFLEVFSISPLLVGVLIFSLGTNLPELSISFKAWRKKNSELSVSNLLGSAAANIFVLGVVASMQKIEIKINQEFCLIASTFLVLIALFAIFYRSQKKFSFFEGLAFVLVYILFLFAQYLFFITY